MDRERTKAQFWIDYANKENESYMNIEDGSQYNDYEGEGADSGIGTGKVKRVDLRGELQMSKEVRQQHQTVHTPSEKLLLQCNMLIPNLGPHLT
jgi:hypothetical protein